MQLLSTFGSDSSNIPEFGVGNCQDWTVAAVSMLERAGIVVKGEEDLCMGMINLSARQIQDHCLETGRKWIPGPETDFEGAPDALIKDENAKKPVGKLSENTALQERMQSLIGDPRFGQQRLCLPVDNRTRQSRTRSAKLAGSESARREGAHNLNLYVEFAWD